MIIDHIGLSVSYYETIKPFTNNVWRHWALN